MKPQNPYKTATIILSVIFIVLLVYNIVIYIQLTKQITLPTGDKISEVNFKAITNSIKDTQKYKLCNIQTNKCVYLQRMK